MRSHAIIAHIEGLAALSVLSHPLVLAMRGIPFAVDAHCRRMTFTGCFMNQCRMPTRVLFIEDSPSDAALLAASLQEGSGAMEFAVTREATLASGLRTLAATPFDLILLDLNLPDSEGFATFERLRAAAPHLPIVILTALGGEDIGLRAVECGAQDFIHKHRIEPYWLKRSVRYAASRWELQQRWREAEERDAAAARAANEARADFLRTMSHEIRSPLAVVLMAADAAQASGDAAQDLERILKTIRTNGLHLKELVDDLLDLAQVEAGRLKIEIERVPCQETVLAAVALVEPAYAQKGVVLSLQFDDCLPQAILTDALRLRQIICNLLSNALKFTDAGGAALVHVRRSASCSHILEIAVTDTGCGIDPARVPELFQPFAQAGGTASRRSGGSGLGLVLSRQMARALGGDVVLSASMPGEGSTFIASIDVNLSEPLPPEVYKSTLMPARDGDRYKANTVLASERPSGEPSAALSRTSKSLAGLHILLADDASDSRHLTKVLFQAEGARVREVTDGMEALRACVETAFDVIVLDVEMPAYNGLAVVKALREQGYSCPIFAHTAHIDGATLDRCLEAGFDGILPKPITRLSLSLLLHDSKGRATAVKRPHLPLRAASASH